ncbi:MAG: response regulator transcription factor [Dehalogenimonas sp.]|uniref:Response regulator transcription factor n=1 Tax=Candidatus Dehalogenimonas loeffleri TaxID=3127115 RepID=A0ABZ2J4R4_9CHLR|nr:response regulator transcription factor [Dehalogenimonas sp.]
MSRIKVLIVDDNFVARRGLRSFLEMEKDISVLGEAANGNDAVSWVKENTPDVVLMDVRMPGMDGIKATSELLNLKPEVKILMLTVVEDQTTILRALLAGAAGYLVYGQFTPDELSLAVRAVAAGHTKVTPPVSHELLEKIRRSNSQIHSIAESEITEPLTVREVEILGLIAAGAGNQEIGQTLYIEEKTVKNHINVIYSKLQIKSRYEAISYMLRHKSNS